MGTEETEESLRAIVQEAVLEYRLCTPFSLLRPFLSHVAWFLVQSIFLQISQSCNAIIDFKEVVVRCTKLLSLENCPATETIQLQVSAHAHMLEQQMILANEEHIHLEKRNAILHAILNTKVLDQREANLLADKFHNLVVEFILETSNRMDDDLKIDLLNEKEIKSSLDSVFPRTGFLYWMSQSDIEKASHMQELSNLVLGICVYKRTRDGRCDANNPIYSSFENEASILEQMVENEINCVLERITAYTKAIDLHIHPLGVHHVLIQRLRDELHYDHQLSVLLQDLNRVLTETHLTMRVLLERSGEQLKILCATIGLETCIPNELVFQDFRNVGLLQKRALTEFMKFRSQRRVAEKLLVFSRIPGYKRTPAGLACLNTGRGLAKIQIMADNCGFLPSSIYLTTSCQEVRIQDSEMSNEVSENIVIIDGTDVSSTTKHLRLHLNGFCLMSIGCHMGLLCRGDPKAGLVQVGDKTYAFQKISYFNEFAKAPFQYLNAFENVVISMPQLINTLGLQRESKFAKLAIPNILELVNKVPVRHTFATQTTTHAQPEHRFDRDTLFLRAKELATKQTHSTQTYTSHFNRDSCSQVWLPRDKSTQSIVAKGTTTPIKLKIFENLRGPPHLKFNTVDILLDV